MYSIKSANLNHQVGPSEPSSMGVNGAPSTPSGEGVGVVHKMTREKKGKQKKKSGKRKKGREKKGKKEEKEAH